MQNFGTGRLQDRLKDINEILDNQIPILQSPFMNSKDFSEIFWINELKFFPMLKKVRSKSSSFSENKNMTYILELVMP